MRTTPEADDLDLPPLDGALGDPDQAPGGPGRDDIEGPLMADDDIEDPRDLGDPLDDTTSESDPRAAASLLSSFADLASDDVGERCWLVDAEAAGTLDVGAFDVSLADESEVLDEDEPEVRAADEDLAADEETVHTDGGEEGPLADDEELREEDLPALDADDDGDVADDVLFERGTIDVGEELRWDDRAWARVSVVADVAEDADDSGMLAVPGEDVRHGSRDATWRKLEETGRITAAALVPGESVVVALDGPDRPVLVRILTDGLARIIAEIDDGAADDDAVACRVTGLRWDAASGCLIATGTFGAQAFRPA